MHLIRIVCMLMLDDIDDDDIASFEMWGLFFLLIVLFPISLFLPYLLLHVS